MYREFIWQQMGNNQRNASIIFRIAAAILYTKTHTCQNRAYPVFSCSNPAASGAGGGAFESLASYMIILCYRKLNLIFCYIEARLGIMWHRQLTRCVFLSVREWRHSYNAVSAACLTNDVTVWSGCVYIEYIIFIYVLFRHTSFLTREHYKCPNLWSIWELRILWNITLFSAEPTEQILLKNNIKVTLSKYIVNTCLERPNWNKCHWFNLNIFPIAASLH